MAVAQDAYAAGMNMSDESVPDEDEDEDGNET